MDRTLVICKPDAVERRLVGQIVARLEAKGLTLVAAELRTIDAETAGRHYAEHEGKPFYGDFVAFITRSPALLMVVEGPGDTYKVVRTLMGVTNPKEAAPGTIRGDLAIELTENLVHGSDSPESAAREIDIFFPGLHSRPGHSGGGYPQGPVAFGPALNLRGPHFACLRAFSPRFSVGTWQSTWEPPTPWSTCAGAASS